MSSNAKTRYTISKTYGPAILNATVSTDQSTAHNMAGMAINGTTAYCAKRSQTGSAIYVIKNIADATLKREVKHTVTIPYAVHGMAYCKNYLFMTCYKNKIIKMPVSSISTGKITEEFTITVDGNGYIPQSISYYGTESNEDLFIVGVGKMNKSDSFFYMIGTLANSKFIEKKRFYVKSSTGYEQAQGIFYHSKYGLLIATNKLTNGSATNYNMILCARIPDKLSSVNNGNIYAPESEFRFNGSSKYTSLAAKSLCISNDGILYVATNATPATAGSGYDNDVIFHVTNPVFPKNGLLEFTLSCNSEVQIPNASGTYNGLPYNCVNPGAFAVNGNTGYCFKTHTADNAIQNKVSILFKSSDISVNNFTEAFSPRKIFTELGHCNGMTFANGFLYVSAYDRKLTPVRKQIAKINPITGEMAEVYECDRILGAIGYYGNNKFIALSYENVSEASSFKEELHFYVGQFLSGRFISDKEFIVRNPFYSNTSMYLQDIHYDVQHGLFFIVYYGDTKISRIYHINSSKILSASMADILIPDEVFVSNSSISEIESLSLTPSGVMYLAQNVNSKKPDTINKVSNLLFID